MKSKINTLWIIALTAFITLAMIACGNNKDEVDNSKFYLDPPTGIVATKLSDNRTLHFTWNAVSGAGRYEINVRTNLDSEDTRLYIGTTTNTRYEHSFYSWYWGYYSRPQEVTTLYYYVKTYPRESGYVASGWSNPVSVDAR
jgi:hypothetical protein